MLYGRKVKVPLLLAEPFKLSVLAPISILPLELVNDFPMAILTVPPCAEIAPLAVVTLLFTFNVPPALNVSEAVEVAVTLPSTLIVPPAPPMTNADG